MIDRLNVSVGALLFCGATLSSGAEARVTTYGPFSLPSDARSQLASAPDFQPIETSRTLFVNYAAPVSHCSNIKIHFSVDGVEKAATAPIAPGRQSGFVNLGPVTPGKHMLSLRGEGVPGGCNNGALSSWGGTFSVQTSAMTNLPARLGPIVFEYRYTNYAWGYVDRGCFIDWDGKAFSWSVRKNPPQGEGGPLTEDALLEAYTDRDAKPGGQLAEAHVRDMRAMVGLAKAAAGGKVVGSHARYDAGEMNVVVYLQSSPAESVYKPIVLAADGDFTETNTSPAAAQLLSWFATTAKESGCSGTGRFQ